MTIAQVTSQFSVPFSDVDNITFTGDISDFELNASVDFIELSKKLDNSLVAKISHSPAKTGSVRVLFNHSGITENGVLTYVSGGAAVVLYKTDNNQNPISYMDAI